MKKAITLFTVFAIVGFLISGCSKSVNNSITFKNSAAGDIFVNFRGELLHVPAGTQLVVKEIDKGTYEYSTTFTVPPGITDAATDGAVSGELSVKAGTKILIFYTSFISESRYTLYATISSSDDKDENSNPLFP